MGQRMEEDEAVVFTGMFTVTGVQGELVDLENWDRNDSLFFRKVFLNGYLERPVEMEDTYLLTLILVGGMWRVEEASGLYETTDIEYGDDIDEDRGYEF